MNNYFKEFLESMNNNTPMMESIISGYNSMVEGSQSSEYEYYKKQLQKDSAFNEILDMLKSASNDKQKTFLINNLITKISEIAGGFDKMLIKVLLEYFGVTVPAPSK